MGKSARSVSAAGPGVINIAVCGMSQDHRRRFGIERMRRVKGLTTAERPCLNGPG
jgi:hypothetical protein